MLEKYFNVIDPADNSNVFGGAIPLDSLITVYTLAPTAEGNGDPVRQFDTLELYESTYAQTVTPSRGRGVYRVTRIR